MKVRDPSLRSISFPASPVRTVHAIPDPRTDVDALVRSVAALKEQVETLTRERGYLDDSAVLVRDIPQLRGILLNAPDDDAQYALLNGVWTRLGRFIPVDAAPPDALTGQIAYADGTNWNPGSGEGLYVLKSSGTWTFIA